MRVKYSNWAAHPGDFRVYVSKPGWSPTSSLGWGDLDLIQTVTNPSQQGSAGTNGGHYYWDLRLPAGRSGNAVIFIQWVRSDSQENFFSCSDVVFDGGNGEVTGIRGGGGTPTPEPPSPTPTPTHTGSCMAVYEVVNSWSGGFQGSVQVMNHGTQPLDGWAVRWKPGTGTKINSVWNGSMTTASDGTVTVRNADHNRTVAADGSTTLGFTKPARRATTSPSAPSVVWTRDAQAGRSPTARPVARRACGTEGIWGGGHVAPLRRNTRHQEM